MKKSLLLIALLVISVSAYAAAPQFPDLPDLKLVINTGLTPAFDIECFNTGDKATSYSVAAFAGYGSMSGSWYLQGGFASATVGTNTFTATNEGGPGVQTNKVKWSTYRISKLPIVGLNVGQSVTINVGSKVSPANPPSFGTAGALVISDPTKVTAVWADANNVTVSLISAATAPVYVSVIASPSATPTVGYDQDKEQIAVYPNLYLNNTFTTAAETTNWGVEPATYANKMNVSWVASQADGAGTVANGVMVLTAPDATYGYKGTNLNSAFAYVAGQWYTARMKYFCSGVVGQPAQAQIWQLSNTVNGTAHIDLATNIVFGVASTWNWLEIPMYSNQAGTGYAQMFFKPAAGALTAYIDEVQIINAKPALIGSNRGCDKLGYAYGDFDAATDSTGWGLEGYSNNFPTKAAFTIAGGKLTFTIAAGSVNGAKWTANNGAPGLYTPASPAIGKDVGIKADVTIQSGALTNYTGIFVNYVYGVTSNGSANFISDGQLIGTAEFGGVSNGTHYNVGPAKNAYYQFQFATKGDQAATVVVDNVDFLSDNDDPNFGDATLFP